VCIVANSEGVVTSKAYLTVKDLCKKVKCPKKQTCVANAELGTAECQCETCSDTEYSPVCGSDCKSYFNQCAMKLESCHAGKNIKTLLKNQQCPKVVPVTLSVGPTEHIVELAQSMTLMCEAEGSPAPTSVRWMKRNKKGVFRPITYEGEFIVQSVRKSTAGEYKCVAKHCDKKIESDIVRVRVETNIVDEPVPVQPTCRIFGDPHIQTFDGYNFEYQGVCDYVVAMDCKTMSWLLLGQFMDCGDEVSCLESLTLYYGSNAPLQITRGWIVGQGGDKMRVKVNEEAMIGDMSIRYTGLSLKVSLPNGVVINWDGLWAVEVMVPKGLSTCGLCGDNDGDKLNDIEGARYTMDTVSALSFADSWKMDTSGWCMKSPDPVPTVDKCGEDKLDIATKRCTEVVENPMFDKCVSSIGKAFYKSACIVDVCLTDIPRFTMATECAVANTLVQSCENAGFKVDKNWAKQVGCPKKRKIQEAIYDAGCPLIGDPPFLETTL